MGLGLGITFCPVVFFLFFYHAKRCAEVEKCSVVSLYHQGQGCVVSGDHAGDFLSPKGHVAKEHLPQQVWEGLGCVSNKLPGISSDCALSNKGLRLSPESI